MGQHKRSGRHVKKGKGKGKRQKESRWKRRWTWNLRWDKREKKAWKWINVKTMGQHLGSWRHDKKRRVW